MERLDGRTGSRFYRLLSDIYVGGDSIMKFSAVKKKARSLFKEASYLQQIKTVGEYEQALALMDELVEDYDNQKPLIELLASSIERWENSATEFKQFNLRLASLDGGDSIMKIVFLNVLPDGELYGFPKQVPNELIIWYDSDEYDLKPGWRKWASEVGGYPKIDGKNVRFGHYMREVDVG